MPLVFDVVHRGAANSSLTMMPTLVAAPFGGLVRQPDRSQKSSP